MNIPLQEGYTIVCVWPGTVIGEDNKDDFVQWCLEEFNTRVQYLEEILTAPDYQDGYPIEGTGGRNDAFFAIHEDDVPKFAIPKIQIGARWLEDVYFNDQGYLYPERVKGYLGEDPTPSESDLGITIEQENTPR